MVAVASYPVVDASARNTTGIWSMGIWSLRVWNLGTSICDEWSLSTQKVVAAIGMVVLDLDHIAFAAWGIPGFEQVCINMWHHAIVSVMSRGSCWLSGVSIGCSVRCVGYVGLGVLGATAWLLLSQSWITWSLPCRARA